MNFEQIVLSKAEIKTLRKSVSADVLCDPTDRLLRLRLVEPQYAFDSGRAPKATGFVRISDLGTDYLAYIGRRFAEYRKTRALSVIAIVISILSLLYQVLQSLWQ